MTSRVRRSINKNVPEITALFTGQLPAFLMLPVASMPLKEIPVFVFHDVEPDRFEAQLRFLQHNDYRTVDANELHALATGNNRRGNEIALTFDDATWTFWTYAYPLLKKYDFRAIVFAIPGVVPEDQTPYPNLQDSWENRCSLEDLEQRGKTQPLCTWRELFSMHESEIIDVQSHSLTHSRVPISPKVTDFLHPDFDTYFYGLNVPVSTLDDQEKSERELRLGAPVFASAARMACRARFKENPRLVKAMIAFVQERGGSTFFNRPQWRRELSNFLRRWPHEALGIYETPNEMESAVRRELAESRKMLEARLPGKQVQHFCYPWFQGSALADDLAAETGYKTLHYGAYVNNRRRQADFTPLRLRRIKEEYLFRLPGKGRLSLLSVLLCQVRTGRSA